LGKLDEADALLSSLLGARLQRYAAASAKLDEAAKAAEERVVQQLRTGSVPMSLQNKVRDMKDEERDEAVRAWASEAVGNDPAVSSAREAYVAFSDIVPVCL